MGFDIAALGDVFVQDSFDTCHRPHASIIGVPEILPSYAGLVVEEEVRELSEALMPKHPAFAIIGGAKFSTKEVLLITLLKTYDHVFVGGALANDVIKAAGHEVGKSLVSDDGLDGIKTLLNNPKFVMPVDVIAVPTNAVGKEDMRAVMRVAPLSHVRPDETILDIGPGTNGL